MTFGGGSSSFLSFMLFDRESGWPCTSNKPEAGGKSDKNGCVLPATELLTNESLCSVKQESMDLTIKCGYWVDLEII